MLLRVNLFEFIRHSIFCHAYSIFYNQESSFAYKYIYIFVSSIVCSIYMFIIVVLIFLILREPQYLASLHCKLIFQSYALLSYSLFSTLLSTITLLSVMHALSIVMTCVFVLFGLLQFFFFSLCCWCSLSYCYVFVLCKRK